jgi:hypothetical protein
MFTKIALVATAAAILLSTASATFAAPKNSTIPEPLYFQQATGEQG